MITCITKNVLADIYISDKFDFFDDLVLKWDNRYKLLIKEITGYDIILLQEIELENMPFVNDLEEYDYFSHKINKKRKTPIGNLILWKRDKFKMVFTDNNSCCLFVCLEYNNTKFLISNVHLISKVINYNIRISQLKSCFKIIDKYKIKTIIAGDFNDILDSDSPVKNLIILHGFKVMNYLKTCYICSENNYLSLDNVVTNNLEIEIINKEDLSIPIPNTNQGSDHLGLSFLVKI